MRKILIYIYKLEAPGDKKGQFLLKWMTYHLSFFSGVFSPPAQGTYLLTVYARSAGSDGNMYIKRGDDVLCNAWIRVEQGATGTCTAIVELLTTDSVRVTGNNSNEATIASPWSGFAGHLVEATES